MNSPSLAVVRPAVRVPCLQEEEKKSAKAAKALNLAMVPAPIVPQPLPPAAPMGGQMQMQQPMQPAPQQPQQQQQPQTPAGVTAAGPIQAGSWQPCYDQALDPAEPSGPGAHLLPDCVCARALRPPRKLLHAFVRAFVRLLHARKNVRAPVCVRVCVRARVSGLCARARARSSPSARVCERAPVFGLVSSWNVFRDALMGANSTSRFALRGQHGRTYYYNHTTKVSVWECPEGVLPPPPRPPQQH